MSPLELPVALCWKEALSVLWVRTRVLRFGGWRVKHCLLAKAALTSRAQEPSNAKV